MDGVDLTDNGSIALVTQDNRARVLDTATGNTLFSVAGSGAGNISVSSEGKILCTASALHCPKDFVASGLRPFIEAIRFGAAPILNPAPAGICNDCLTRTIVIQRRDADGRLRSYTATWNDLNASAIPPEVMKLYESVVTLAR